MKNIDRPFDIASNRLLVLFLKKICVQLRDKSKKITLQNSSNVNDKTPVIVNTPAAVLHGRAAPANMLRKNPIRIISKLWINMVILPDV